MASLSLSYSTDYANLFRRRILQNAQYWSDFVANQATNVAALDSERDGIIKAITFAIDLIEAWPLVYEVMAKFSPHLERRGHWEGWNLLLERSIRQAEQSGHLAAAINLSTLLARLCQRQNQTTETIRHYRRVIHLARQLGDSFSLARACTNLGYLYIQRGRWQRAEILCCCALAIFEQLDSNHGRAHTENHLGLLYTQLGLWDQAGRHLERACAIWQTMADNHGLMYGFLNLGLLYVEMGYPDQALIYSTQALHQANLTGEELQLGNIYMNMGLAYQLQGQLYEAESYTRQAETIFRRFFNTPGIVDTLENLGGIYLKRKQWAEASACLENALAARRTLQHKHDEIQVLIYLADCELARGNQHQAVLWLNEAKQQLSQHPQAGRYYQLQAQVDEIQRTLAGQPFDQPSNSSLPYT